MGGLLSARAKAKMGDRDSVMASLSNPKTVTYEEWLRMPEVQDSTEEVVNG